MCERPAGGAASLRTNFGLSCPLNAPEPDSQHQVVPVVAAMTLIMKQQVTSDKCVKKKKKKK